MPRKNRNARRPNKHSRRIEGKPVVRFIDVRTVTNDDISPGRLVCVAEYIGVKF